jgi:hypothetical protein
VFCTSPSNSWYRKPWQRTTQPIESTRRPLRTRISGTPPSFFMSPVRQLAPKSQHAMKLRIIRSGSGSLGGALGAAAARAKRGASSFATAALLPPPVA